MQCVTFKENYALKFALGSYLFLGKPLESFMVLWYYTSSVYDV